MSLFSSAVYYGVVETLLRTCVPIHRFLPWIEIELHVYFVLCRVVWCGMIVFETMLMADLPSRVSYRVCRKIRGLKSRFTCFCFVVRDVIVDTVLIADHPSNVSYHVHELFVGFISCSRFLFCVVTVESLQWADSPSVKVSIISKNPFCKHFNSVHANNPKSFK